MLSKSIYSPSVLFKSTNNFGCIFPNHLQSSICETKFLTHISFHFSTLYCRITLTFFSKLKTFLLLASVTMLLLYQFPVKCRSGKVRGQLHAQKELPLYLSLSRHGIYRATWMKTGEGDGWILKIAYFFQNCIETDNWQCLCVRGRSSWECR
jgi:hypothetical protein